MLPCTMSFRQQQVWPKQSQPAEGPPLVPAVQVRLCLETSPQRHTGLRACVPLGRKTALPSIRILEKTLLDQHWYQVTIYWLVGGCGAGFYGQVSLKPEQEMDSPWLDEAFAAEQPPLFWLNILGPFRAAERDPVGNSGLLANLGTWGAWQINCATVLFRIDALYYHPVTHTYDASVDSWP